VVGVADRENDGGRVGQDGGSEQKLHKTSCWTRAEAMCGGYTCSV
jgi:hypothetical protein